MNVPLLVSALLSIILLLFLNNNKTFTNELSGGDRAAIFNRFNYEPLPPYSWPFISKLDQNNLNTYAKHYNNAGPLKIIMDRPYRNYTMPDGNWGYPWHFPEYAYRDCYILASDRCDEPINWKKELIRPSQCFDSVYKQCRKGIDPLLIKVSDKGVYDYFYE